MSAFTPQERALVSHNSRDVGTFCFDLPMPPSVWKLYQGNGTRRIKSKEYKQWITEAGWMLIAERNRGGRHKCITDDVEVRVRAYRPSARKRDLDNILKAILDLLTSTKTIEDDAQVVAIDARWVSSGVPCVVEVAPVPSPSN